MVDFLSPNARKVLLPDRRCTAISKTTGERCLRSSALGQFVCDMHGAKTPAGIQAAKERMAMLLEPALEVLYRATRQAPPCEHCGRSDADRDPGAIRAAQIILDRAGFGPRGTMEIVTTPASSHSDLSDDELITHYERALESARRAVRDSRPAAIDADVYTVPDDDEPPVSDNVVPGVNPVEDSTRVDTTRANETLEAARRALAEAETEYAQLKAQEDGQ
jgi:hypothetical protein